MRIEIWSDVVCPWCYIGKRRLEKALGSFPGKEDVEIVWRSFQLDPSAPAIPVETVAESLGRKYGGGVEGGKQMIDRVEAVAAEEGLLFRHHASLRVSTVDAHRVLHLALETGGPELQGRLKEALLAAYFIETENVADHDTLARIAVAAGLDEARVRAVLATDEYADAVEADVREAAALGATGVPFYVVDRKYGISGAQSPEVFADVLEKAWNEAHPKLDLVGGGDADACGPDGCAI
ncbi:DsbA family oxidoreductase [Nocardioides marmoriginsengisoli]|uniref:DsbA family oxidoreductase n=1 Tax=Nocardioides marmoriginsengisoli TaxID=661483 RepID=A0A3N0CQL1_9ACTN|nr:DsbA family oxidoreductase [Nocardioides marmoriginsengisoli]RNL65193.1 DsbA family oxidoreductase [Nocardioides marmoriginsengisoli]